MPKKVYFSDNSEKSGCGAIGSGSITITGTQGPKKTKGTPVDNDTFSVEEIKKDIDNFKKVLDEHYLKLNDFNLRVTEPKSGSYKRIPKYIKEGYETYEEWKKDHTKKPKETHIPGKKVEKKKETKQKISKELKEDIEGDHVFYETEIKKKTPFKDVYKNTHYKEYVDEYGKPVNFKTSFTENKQTFNMSAKDRRKKLTKILLDKKGKLTKNEREILQERLNDVKGIGAPGVVKYREKIQNKLNE